MSDVGSISEGGSSAPVAPGGYARKATGLVRQVTGLDQLLFNAASTTPLGLAVVSASSIPCSFHAQTRMWR